MRSKNSAAANISLRTGELLAAVLLFFAATAVVVWQNSRLAVLWDLSYILENANRIALGQIPYRDFPFPYAPLTFLIQAALIKLTGRVFWHTIVYAALINGLSIILTWRIVARLLPKEHGKWLALLLVLPLVPLGLYSIFPHPFYDPDCTFAILLAIYLWQRADVATEHGGRSRYWPSLLAGMTLVIPLFVKQNTGLPFLGAAVLGLAILIFVAGRRARRHHLLMIQGASIALIIALWSINWFAGIKNYWHWTIQFAASRRTPARAEMLEIYSDRMLLIWLALFVLGAALLWFSRRTLSRWLPMISALLMAAPFVWPMIYLLRDSDSSERAERLLNTWPVLLIISVLLTIVTIRRSRTFDIILTFVLIGTINGAFMSQQLWGSTYAIWPFYSILLAMTFARLNELCPGAKQLWTWPLAGVIAMSLLISGGFYLKSHERLDYANLDEGELKRSTLPPLRGLATRGDWVPSFEELVRYTDQHIPRDEGILLLPGEDLFYFTTGRTPKFPVLMFDHTVNPFSAAEIVNLARERDIRWLIVKQEMQDEDEGIEKQRDELTQALEADFEQVESLSNYEIYHRRDPNEKDDDDDDGPK
jgi:hypothetical protein